MDYRYSVVVDPSTYDDHGLCGGIPLRMHTNSRLENIGCVRAHEDLSRLVQNVKNYRGGLGPKYNVTSVTMPECLPERLEIISYANEYLFLHDDIADNGDQEEGDVENDQMMASRQGTQTGTIKFQKDGSSQMKSKILLEMLALDRPRALTLMKVWADFVEATSSRQHPRFATLEEYIPYRLLDVGETLWIGVCTFGMAITIAEHEMDTCSKLTRSAWIAIGLTNDLFSWQKEYDASRRKGQPEVVNAIQILMRQHSITVDEAKVLCKSKINEYVAEYVKVVEHTKQRTDLSLDLRKYVEATQDTIIGNVVWSSQCPRYNAEASLNEAQLSLMKNGVGKIRLDSRAEPDPAPGPSLTNSAKLTNGVQTVDGVNGVKVIHGIVSVNGDTDENKHDTVKGTAQKRKFGDDETNGFRIGKPRLDVPTKEMKFTTSTPERPELGDKIISAPFEYLTSLPSKGVRDRAIDALNIWIQAPLESINAIKTIIDRLHNASLMLDDFQDSSPLRRGRPATHTIFGAAQTINSANYWILEALGEIRRLRNPDCVDHFIDEMRNLYIGQSLDLYWTYNVECPTVEEYLNMIDNKTGGTFRMIARLMLAHSTVNPEMDLHSLPTLLGRYFQIRDDYQNLVSPDYAKTKGFCEDLDEGKYSLPLIHTLQNSRNAMQIRSILMQRRVAGKSNFEHKQLILDHLKTNKSFEFTASVLKSLGAEMDLAVKRVETTSGTENLPLRLLLSMLSIDEIG